MKKQKQHVAVAGDSESDEVNCKLCKFKGVKTGIKMG
jgi:hypothetical protein